MTNRLMRTWPLFLALAGIAMLGFSAYKVMTLEDEVEGPEDVDLIDVEPFVAKGDAPANHHYVEAERVLTPNIREFVGEVTPGGTIEVRAPQGMRVPVVELHVESGFMVSKGDPLVTFQRERIEKAIAEAEKKQDWDALARFKDYLEHVVITSPVDGQVAEIYTANPGDVPLDRGIPLMTISDPERWNLFISLPDDVVRETAPMGTELEVTLEDNMGTVKGKVTALGDPRTTDTAIVPRPGHTLVILSLEPHPKYEPGLAATVTLPLGEREVVRIPADAVREEDGVHYVRVWDDGDVERSVLVESEEGDSVLIRAGVHPGQSVLVPGPARE